MVAASAVSRADLERQLYAASVEAERLKQLTPKIALAGGDPYEEHVAALRGSEHEIERLTMALVGHDAAVQAAAEEISASERAREEHELRELEREQARLLIELDRQLAPLNALAGQYRGVYHKRFTAAKRLGLWTPAFRVERDIDELAREHLGAGTRISRPTLDGKLEQARQLVGGSSNDV